MKSLSSSSSYPGSQQTREGSGCQEDHEGGSPRAVGHYRYDRALVEEADQAGVVESDQQHGDKEVENVLAQGRLLDLNVCVLSY